MVKHHMIKWYLLKNDLYLSTNCCPETLSLFTGQRHTLALEYSFKRNFNFPELSQETMNHVL